MRAERSRRCGASTGSPTCRLPVYSPPGFFVTMAVSADTPTLAPRAPIKEPGSMSQWALIGRRLFKHRLAVVSLFLLAVLYVLAAGAEFFAPYSRQWRDLSHKYCPPQLPRFSWREGWHVPAMRVFDDPL